jgi:hypothetical protein
MATLDELRAANEGFEEQMHDWRRQRYANGENPMDWVAFRKHLEELGAPDPGEAAPDEFHRWDDQMHGGQVSEVNSLKAGVGASGDTSTWPSDAGSGSTTSHWAKPKTEQ